MGDLVQLAQEAAKPPVEKSKFRVFVFGPFLNPAETVAPPTIEPITPDAIVEHAKYLRFATKKALEAEGFTVDYGETKEIYDAWVEKFSKGDLATFEQHHARKHCGAVVIYPSSIGSICEFTLFASFDKIAKKTQAIVHKPYADHNSFFMRAVLEVFKQDNGTPEFIDYANHEQCVEAARKYVIGKWHKMLRDFDKHEDSVEWSKEYAEIIRR
jgi:hypothetical protein